MGEDAAKIAESLSRAYEEAPVEDVDLDSARLVIFSDHHKGGRDAADDFRRAERAYCAALGRYLEDGFDLIALGDVEELWECRPEEVIQAYPAVLELEGEFQAAGRYRRFWGNHDDQWRDSRQVEKHLHRFYPGLEVGEALRLRISAGGAELGEIFLAHGHQGTMASERFAWFSRLIVRYVWRPLQRRLNMGSNTPASDYELRAEHDAAMFAWARSHPTKPVLITGHTHRPVFGTSRPPKPRRRPATELRSELEAARKQGDRAAAAALRSELELVEADARRGDRPPQPIDPPCYFNTGCCSFADGDVTGLEITGGRIRLVRWLDDDDEPKPKLLVEDGLREIFGRVRPK